MKTYILWDLDGSLIESGVTTDGLHLDAITYVTGATPATIVDRDANESAGDYLTRVLAANGHSGSLLEATLFQLDSLARDRFTRNDPRTVLPGVDAALDAVEQVGHTNALFTSHRPERARYLLLSRGIDPARFDWEHSFFGDDSPARSPLADDERVVAIGSTPLQSRVAASARVPFIGIATGLYGAARLRATGATDVLDDLSATDRFVEAIRAASSSELDQAREPASARR